MDVFVQVVQVIIKEQEHVIGPLAIEQAQKVNGLTVTNDEQVALNGDKVQIINNLVGQYEQIFGPASVYVCKEAAAHFISAMPPEQVPAALR